MIDAHVISLDRTYPYIYSISDEDKPYIRSIQEAFLYDANSAIHLCELKSSYELLYLYTSITCNEDVSDEIVERLYEKYGMTGENIYMHCRDVDGIVKNLNQWRHYHAGEFTFEDHDETMEELREKYSCNHMVN